MRVPYSLHGLHEHQAGVDKENHDADLPKRVRLDAKGEALPEFATGNHLQQMT